jgi:hypothetical protein
MKKILLATSALVLSAAAANAQAVRITGEGRMGIMYSSVRFVGITLASGWAQENRLRLNFNVSVQADHGLSFGAFSRVRINNGGSVAVVTGVMPVIDPVTGLAVVDPVTGAPVLMTTTTRMTGFSGSRVWVEANNFRLTFGNQDGAFRGQGTSHGYLGGCGVGYEGGILCGDTAGLLGRTQGFDSVTGGPVARARVDYSFGDTRIALSADRNGSTEIGIRSRFDAFTVALGYSNRASVGGAPGNTVALSGHYNGGTWGVGVLVARLTDGIAPFRVSVTNWSVSGNVELGGGNLYGYVGRVGGANTVGISYGYGLGGGATLTAGLERISTSFLGFTTSATGASIGVAFNF